MHDESWVLEAGRQHRVACDDSFDRARRHFASLVHDEVLPVVESSAAHLQAVLDALAVEADVTDAVVAATAALGEVRGAEHRLHSALATALDGDPDPDPELVRQLTVCGRRLSTGREFSFDVHDTRAQDAPVEVERALLQVGLEAIENSACHAGASRVRVRLADRHGGVELTVANNGVGAGRGAASADHLGVRMMDRSASVMGGWVRIEPGLVGGTIVTCWFPLVSAQVDAPHGDRSAAS